MVYYRTVNQTKRLVEVLGCSVFYREVGSEEQKRGILRRLTSGKEQVFTATNALGLGRVRVRGSDWHGFTVRRTLYIHFVR